MIGKAVRTIPFAAGLLCATSAMAQVTIHLSPKGNDSNPGTEAKPVKSLEKAQELVRAKNASNDVTVILADGTYRLTKPLIFRQADGGQKGYSVEWRAADGAHPTITSGITVTGFRPYDKERHIYVADTPKGLDTRQIWINGTRGESPFVEIPLEDLKFSATGFEVTNPEYSWLADIAHPDRVEAEATGIFTDRYSPVESIDGTRFTMSQPAWDNNTWGYDTASQPLFPEESRFFLRGALEFIGKVGQWHSRWHQWVIHPDEGKLYLRTGQDENISDLDVVVPTLEVLVSISGTPDAPIEKLSFRGLRFSHTSWLGPSRDTGYANQQSGAYLSDISPLHPDDAWKNCGWGCVEFESMRLKWHQIPGAVQVSAARDITFEGNTFSQLGQVALGIGNEPLAHETGVGLATSNIRVARNRFAVLAGGAIMAGGVRTDAHHPSDPALINRDLRIEDNVIHLVSQDYKDNAAILSTYFDGATIAHNDISGAPYDAIATGWGWGYNDAGGNPNYDKNQKGYVHNPRFQTSTTLRNTVVEGNRIHGVKQWYMDGGAIYNLSANPNAIIRRNHIFDINGKIAIYLDEGSKHFTVTENVVDTDGVWLNINTAGKMYDQGISTDNRALGNWRNSLKTGGRWLPDVGNDARGNHLVPDSDWPAEALKVIEEAGPRN
ncbi:right-handed parallel beta-helix repeat-containing protein [Tsuneonella suprasediminis]|uniref:Right-handed parallel beta-helix repeat-containing protein n=1 Tax=Tsuneonella suprasediminis TaxID=2306996 RepID=A0A419R3Z0_9SPHN|nr:right-handed parallel beta-helix repeat-containing protein [Tsuneonella suprasediminis]RJX69231.1 right-handed parallel beta-helix repeat-containing protein [Tsuneonella suprasediminis]